MVDPAEPGQSPSKVPCPGLRGLDSPQRPPPEVRSQIQDWFASEGRNGLAQRLRELAPDRYRALDDPLNPRRLMRALELHLSGTAAPTGWDEPPTSKLVGLRMDRNALTERIGHRVAAMYANGLLEEADRLRSHLPEISVTARAAIGYAEAFAVLDNVLSQDQAMERTAIRTRQLAKRQMTWFRRKLTVRWIDITPDLEIGTLAREVVALWEETGPSPIHREPDHDR